MVATMTYVRRNFKVSLSTDLYQHKRSRKLLLMQHSDRTALSPVMLNDRDNPRRKNESPFVPSIQNWPDTESQRPCTSSLSPLVINAACHLIRPWLGWCVFFAQDYFSHLHFQPSVLGVGSDSLHCARTEFTKICYPSQKLDRAKYTSVYHLYAWSKISSHLANSHITHGQCDRAEKARV